MYREAIGGSQFDLAGAGKFEELKWLAAKV